MPFTIVLLLFWPPTPHLIIQERHVSQLGGSWEIRYSVVYSGPPASLDGRRIECVGTYSNSSVPGHQHPVDSTATGENQAHAIISKVCREIALLDIAGPSDAAPFKRLSITVRLKHDHPLYDRTDALLGKRKIIIWLAQDMRLVDEFDLYDGDIELEQPKLVLSHADMHMDDIFYRSAPDSIMLGIEWHGMQFVRFDDVPVRPGMELKLSFWYAIGRGNMGQCFVRVCQYSDMPNIMRREPDAFDIDLSEATQGPWHYFEQTWRLGRDTNTLAVDFRILGPDLGGLWVDDWKLEYVGADIKQLRR